MNANQNDAALNPRESVPESPHSHDELWKWTLTKDAVAPCRIQDVFNMKECAGSKGEFYTNNKVLNYTLIYAFCLAGTDPDFYWLGRVPCRTVLFYGLVVGVQTYETRTLYSGMCIRYAHKCLWNNCLQLTMALRSSTAIYEPPFKINSIENLLIRRSSYRLDKQDLQPSVN